MECFYKTDIGTVRDANEDFVFASQEPVGSLQNLFLVADGMGGHQGGEYASRYVVERLVRLVAENKKRNPVTILNEAIAQVNSELREQSSSNDNLDGMGTTLVAATIQDRTLYVANIGDSRLYLVGRQCRQVTRDHSWVEEMVNEGKLEKNSEIYWKKKNIITRAIGVADEVNADFFEVDMQPGDKILMCTDGLSNMVTDHQITEILSEHFPLEQLGLNLIKQGMINGGRDNISVILVDPERSEVTAC